MDADPSIVVGILYPPAWYGSEEGFAAEVAALEAVDPRIEVVVVTYEEPHDVRTARGAGDPDLPEPQAISPEDRSALSRIHVALAIDLSFGGESGGSPRHASSPETYVEDIKSAVDWIGLQPFVDRERIGLIGICASGGFATAAASLDPRIKALATFSMYDMGKAVREGLGHAVGRDARLAMLAAASEQRWREAAGAQTAYAVPAFPTTPEATAALYELSLIHISEPTRPY